MSIVKQDVHEDTFDNFALFIVDVVLFFLLILIYSATIFFLLVRGKYQPLKNRGSTLILLSVVGNFTFTLTLIINKLIANAYQVGSFYYSFTEQGGLPPPNKAAIELSCALSHIQYGFFLPLFLLPYYFRCFRLLQVFRAHNKHFVLKKEKGVFAFKRVKSLYCVREVNMIKWLSIILLPFGIVTLVAILKPSFRNYFPSFEVLSCFQNYDEYIDSKTLIFEYNDHLIWTIQFYLILNFFLDAVLMTFIYLLRHVQDEFSINQELKIVAFVQATIGFICFFLLIVVPDAQINKSNNMQYIMIVRSLILLAVTAILPIKRSYNPNSIIPFPINEECIKTLEMALLMPTSANYFYDYLESSSENKDALIYFGLYADIRTYLRMIEDGESELGLRRHAEQIYNDYINPNRQWDIDIPVDIMKELSSSFNNGSITNPIDENLFTSLYIYTLDILDMYYKEFQKSKRFEELRDEVSKQEILYEILRRYSMISN